jgi:GT2 family glycosyltransferase
MSFAVVVPSRNVNNLVRCVAAVWQNEPRCRIIVVDDGLPLEALKDLDLEIVPGIKPFVFARNCNLGISQAFSAPVTYDVTAHSAGCPVAVNDPNADGVILLNDDALLTTPGGFTALSEQAAAHPEYGIIAAACNNTGNLNQNPQGKGLRDESRMVCFTCVYIPRQTLDAVGLLDQRFEGYGLDDDDMCLRIRNAGLKIGIYDGCVVDHKTLHSQYRGTGGGDFRPNLEIFKAKWGMDNFGRPA